MTISPPSAENGYKLAIIDLGSNTTRMLVMHVTENGAYHLVEEDKGVVRLSAGEASGGDIKKPALLRAIGSMRLFKGICDYHRVTRTIAVATAAVREAGNREEFLRALHRETGIEFRVLSREEEPYFGYLGVINTMAFRDGLIMDLGGGSLEITAVKDRAMVHSTSIPYGALNLTEGFLGEDRPSDAKLKDLEGFLKQKFKEVDWLDNYINSPLVGIGGTIRTIARVHQRVTDYPFDELHNYPLLPPDIAGVYDLLKGMGLKERGDVPGLSRDRADIIVAGTAVVHALVKYLKVPLVRVSSSGLRDGVFFHEYLKEPVVPDIASFCITNISRLYSLDAVHAGRVWALAEKLFEGLRPLNGFTAEHKRILWAAASLHELGYYYDFSKRFNNTFYHIIDNTVYGFTHMENYKMALVAAHHGAGGIKARSTFLNVPLAKDEMKDVKRLSVILGLADAFDRSRRGLVTDIACRVSKSSVEIGPIFQGEISIEAISAGEMSGYFKKAFDRDLVITIWTGD